jgi:hypothetical protein
MLVIEFERLFFSVFHQPSLILFEFERLFFSVFH